jgi:hypothetical protein
MAGFHFSAPPLARFVRIRPLAWHNNIALRAELFVAQVGGFFCFFSPNFLSAGRYIDNVGEPAGLENGSLADESLSCTNCASPQWNASHARLNQAGGWAPAALGDALTVDLGKPSDVACVLVQGSPLIGGWVSSLLLETSLDGRSWAVLNRDGTPANTDATSVAAISIPAASACRGPARFVRLTPRSIGGAAAGLRAEVLLSPLGHEVGVASGALASAQMTASSQLGPANPAAAARLFGAGCWMPATMADGDGAAELAGEAPFLQVALDGFAEVTAVVVQGHPSQASWVTALAVETSLDGATWVMSHPGVVDSAVLAAGPNAYAACRDASTPSLVRLGTPTIAHLVRLRPLAWHNAPALRVELYVNGIGRPIGLQAYVFVFLGFLSLFVCFCLIFVVD